MRELFTLVGRITSDGYATLNKNLNAIDKSANKVANQLNLVGRRVEKAGANITRLTAPLIVAGAAVVKFGADFEKSMTNSLSIMGDLSDSMRNDMEDAARSVAKTTKFSAKEAADSYFFLASAGLKAAESIEALPKVAAFAQAGNFDLALATDLLTDAQSALGLVSDNVAESMENMTRVSDVLVKANTIANASVQQFSESLTNKAGAALRLLKKDVEEGAAVLAVYADQGVKGKEAGSQLNIVLRDLQKAAVNNKKAFIDAGVAVFDSQGNMRNMADIVEQLEGRLLSMSDEQKRTELALLGFTDKSISATTALLGTSDAIRTYEDDLRNAAGTTQTVADKQIKNFWDQLGLLKDRLIDVGLTLWKSLNPILKNHVIPTVEKITKKIENLAEWFDGLSPSIKSALVSFTGFVIVIGPILMITGKLLQSFKTLLVTVNALRAAMLLLNASLLTNPFVLLATGIGVAIFAVSKLVKRYDDLKEAHKEWEVMTSDNAATKNFLNNIDAVRKGVIALGEDASDLTKVQEMFGKEIDNLTESARAMGETVEGDLTQRLNSLFAIETKLRDISYEVADGNLRVVEAAEKETEATEDLTKATAALTKEQQGYLEGLQQRAETAGKSQLETLAIEESRAVEHAQRMLGNTQAFVDAELAIRIDFKAKKDKIIESEKEATEAATAAAKTEYDILREAQLQFLAGWEKRAFEASATKLKILDAEIEDAKNAARELISNAEERERAISDIEAAYAKKRKQIKKEELDEKDKMARASNAIESFLSDERVQMAIDAAAQLLDVFTMATENKITLIDQELQKNIEAIEMSGLNEEEKQKKISELEKKADVEKKKLMIKQAKRDKAAAIFSAVINTAVAIGKALDLGFPLGIPAAIVMGALGAAQIAVIAAQPLPQMAEGGLVRSRAGGVTATIGEGSQDEAVLPMKTGVREISDSLISNMKAAVLPMVAPAPAFAGGGFGGGTAGRTTQNVYQVGTIIASDVDLKNLENTLFKFRIGEEQRKGDD
ncbi:MAG: phage tail tape measure protein [Bacteroidetes bacterium]|nr:phage tail tape measure protein [Bacteroidota bacterium]